MPPLSVREITRDVWNNNLEDAMRDLRRLVDSYPYIAIVSPASSGDSTYPARANITPALFSAGLRVSSRRSAPNWQVQNVDGLSLPDDAL